MKAYLIGFFVAGSGLVIAIALWAVGYFVLPNADTHRHLAANPKIQTSAQQTSTTTGTSGASSGSSTSSGTSGQATASGSSGGNTASASGTTAPSTLVQLPKISTSQIHLVDTSMPGYSIFESTCAGCHGSSAEGQFGPPIYAIGKYWSQQQILAFVTQGRGSMPPRGGLSSDSQVKSVVAWLSKQKG